MTDPDKLAGQIMIVSAIVFTLAFVTILTAHAFEEFGGYAPCPLCLQERYAYYFAVPAALMAPAPARVVRSSGVRAGLPSSSRMSA
jgi:disulfide bond formation protein DsbB